MDTFYKELLKSREDADFKSKDLADWKTKISADLIQFYRKYETILGESNFMGKADKEILNQTINELTDNIAKSKIY